MTNSQFPLNDQIPMITGAAVTPPHPGLLPIGEKGNLPPLSPALSPSGRGKCGCENDQFPVPNDRRRDDWCFKNYRDGSPNCPQNV